MNRRRFLVTTSGLTLLATAGCSQLSGGDDDDSGSDGSNGGGETDSPGAVVEAFYDLTNTVDENSDPSEVISRLQELSHSASPFSAFTESDIDPGANSDVTVENVETEVTSEDLTADELEQQYGLSRFETVEEDDVEAIAEENAVVEASLTQSGEGVEEGQEETTQEHLTATEGGEWLLFF
jgi:hypothetical protein